MDEIILVSYDIVGSYGVLIRFETIFLSKEFLTKTNAKWKVELSNITDILSDDLPVTYEKDYFVLKVHWAVPPWWIITELYHSLSNVIIVSSIVADCPAVRLSYLKTLIDPTNYIPAINYKPIVRR